MKKLLQGVALFGMMGVCGVVTGCSSAPTTFEYSQDTLKHFCFSMGTSTRSGDKYTAFSFAKTLAKHGAIDEMGNMAPFCKKSYEEAFNLPPINSK